MSRRLTGPLTDEQIAELKTRLPLNEVEYIKAEREALASSVTGEDAPPADDEEKDAPPADDEEKKTTSAKK